ncbi:MAG: hypothetical protein SOI13_01480 [Bifidobacterium mongoliense]|jgi:hypothetical protein|uniref:hypothetical protein n=1 Tax=Bifidobacterium mongoliense TaxID=518643 RepID=UPI002F352215
MRHALPVKWDGHPILWDTDQGWSSVSDLMICGGTTKNGWKGCEQCHTQVMPRTINGQVCDFTPHRLVLFRCMTCGYTTVSELTGHGWREWILDESDYGDQGSNYLEQGTLI